MKILIKNDDEFEGIETSSNVYYLRNPQPLSEAKKFLDLIKSFEKNFDTSLIDTEIEDDEGEEWYSADKISEFLKIRTKRSVAFFKILAEQDDWISTKELLDIMGKAGFKELVSQSLSGIRSGNTKSFRNWEKDPLDESEWHADEWQNYYRIKPKYLKLLREAIVSDDE